MIKKKEYTRMGIIFFLLLYFVPDFLSQISKDFDLTVPYKIISPCYYNTINFLDSRTDTALLGNIYEGAESRKLKVIPRIALHTQFNGLIATCTDSTAGNGELLLQLRKFRFSEMREKKKEFGYCILRADLFCKADSNYFKLETLDTLIVLESEKDVTNLLFEKTSAALCNFVFRNLNYKPLDGLKYSFNDVQNISLNEKRSLPLYNATEFTNGVYYTYNTFKNQRPDCKIVKPRIRQGNLIKVTAIDGKKEEFVLSPREIYGYVFEGKPYVINEYGFYTIQKKEDEFYLIGKDLMPLHPGQEIISPFTVTLMSGLAGWVIYSHFISKKVAVPFLMSLDHVNGSFNKIKQIKN